MITSLVLFVSALFADGCDCDFYRSLEPCVNEHGEVCYFFGRDCDFKLWYIPILCEGPYPGGYHTEWDIVWGYWDYFSDILDCGTEDPRHFVRMAVLDETGPECQVRHVWIRIAAPLGIPTMLCFPSAKPDSKDAFIPCLVADRSGECDPCGFNCRRPRMADPTKSSSIQTFISHQAITHSSSACLPTCGNSSLISVPHSPWRL